MNFCIPIQTGLEFMNDPEFVKMLEEFEQELENLSPEERRQFDEMIDEFTRVIQEMPEEDFNQLLQDINTDFSMAETAHLDDTAVTKENIPAPVVQITIPDEIKRLAETLQTIRTYLSVFLIKIQISPELSLKIDKWIQQEKIEDAPQGYTWDQGNHDIEKFSVLISNLLETNKQMNPVFLFEIHKDEALENILHTLAEQLTIVPSINIVEFGFKQEREAKEQIKEVLSYICKALFTHDLITKLDLVFKAHQKEVETNQIDSGKVRNEFIQPTATNMYNPNSESPYQQNYYDYDDMPREDYDYYDNHYYDNNRYSPSYSQGRGYDHDDSRNSLPDKQKESGRDDSHNQKPDRTEEKLEETKKDVKTVSANLQKQLSEIEALTNNTNIDSFEKYLKNDEINFTIQNTLQNAESIGKKVKDATETTNELIQLISEEKKPKRTIRDIQEKIESEILHTKMLNERLLTIVSGQASYSLEKRFGHFDDLEALETLKKTNPRRAKDLEVIQDQYISIETLSKNCNKLLETLQPFIETEKEELEEIQKQGTPETVIPEGAEVSPGKIEELPEQLPTETTIEQAQENPVVVQELTEVP